MGELAGKAVVLTGASQGIGKALAHALAAEGCRLVLAARDEVALTAVAGECRARGAEAHVVRCDVGVQSDCEALIARAVERLGGLDVLVNNAGIGMIARFEDVTDLEPYERVMRVNYLSCVWSTHAALPHLKRSRGLIVAVASLAGLTGVPTRTAYAASKHAVFGFYDSLRIELMGSGVGVTIVAPDFVVSEIHRRAMDASGRPLGKSPMQEARIMGTDECAGHILRAMRRRDRLWLGSLRGRFGRLLQIVAPGLIDRIAKRAVERGV